MLAMPLLLFDLDNTLLPRDAAFRAWAEDFLTELGLPPAEIDWLTTIDGGGYVPRSTVLSAARRRYGLEQSLEFLLAHYRRGINSYISCPTRHIDALRAARSAGWTLGIVSNGGTRPQLEKIRRTGLGPLVDGWVISEEARCTKPDPLIFEIAAHRCGVAPTGDWATNTWMIGDYAPTDIAGAELTGLRSVWLHHGRPWPEPGFRPTLSAAGLPEAVGLVLSARSAPTPRPGVRASGRPSGRPAAGASALTGVSLLPAHHSSSGTAVARAPIPAPALDAVGGTPLDPARGAAALALPVEQAHLVSGAPTVRKPPADRAPAVAGPSPVAGLDPTSEPTEPTTDSHSRSDLVPAPAPASAAKPAPGRPARPRPRTHFAVPASRPARSPGTTTQTGYPTGRSPLTPLPSITRSASPEAAVAHGPGLQAGPAAPTGPSPQTGPGIQTGPAGSTGASAKISAIARSARPAGVGPVPPAGHAAGDAQAAAAVAGPPRGKMLREPATDYLAPGATG